MILEIYLLKVLQFSKTERPKFTTEYSNFLIRAYVWQWVNILQTQFWIRVQDAKYTQILDLSSIFLHCYIIAKRLDILLSVTSEDNSGQRYRIPV